MNELRIKELNNNINTQEGKIYFDESCGHTSELLNSLYKQGYKTGKDDILFVLKDKNGEVIKFSHCWTGLLLHIAKSYERNIDYFKQD